MTMNSQSSKDEQEASATEEPPADYETAIEACGFGLFNVLLLLIAMCAAVGTVFETSTISYILPSAECDLKLTLLDKGILNAITYAGMITSAIVWGYIADLKGRRNILIFGYLCDVMCVLGGALSQSRIQLMIFKYFGGFVMCGPFAVLMSYLTEFHGKQHRQRIMMIVGMMFTVASLLLPILALLILPQPLNFELWNLKFSSWKIFLAVSSLPSLISAVFIPFFPETPKFLMSKGRNRQALKSFQFIYALNTRKPIESFKIKRLVCEVETRAKCSEEEANGLPNTIATVEGIKITRSLSLESAKRTSKLSEGLSQLRPLFAKPYLGLSLQVYVLNFCILLGQNTVRLWLPQLFASINEFGEMTGMTASMCAILEYSVNKTAMAELPVMDKCEVVITAASYTNNIIVALGTFCGYLVAGAVINRIGGKPILIFATLIAGTCGIALYWAASALATLILSTLFVTLGSISSTSVINASVNLFPTSLRTMIVSLAMMFGRTGSLLGNVFFPMFMSLGCIPPFLMIGSVMLAACAISLFLPSTNKLSLK